MMTSITSVQFEHFSPGSVLGIGTPSPRLSWKIECSADSWTQCKYEIQLVRADGRVITSSQVISSQSVFVEWPFTALRSRERAYVKVRVWGLNDDSPSAWSDTVFLECGILSREEWNGYLITSNIDEDPDVPKPETVFRRTFEVREHSSFTARLYVTAHGVYKVEANGKSVSDDFLAPGWSSYGHRIRQAVYDVTDFLTTGFNTIDVSVAEGWYSGRLGWDGGMRNMYGSRVGLLANLEIRYDDCRIDSIVTDRQWLVRYGPARLAELYNGEKYDATYCVPNWSSVDFETAGWKFAMEHPIPLVEIFLPTGPTARPVEEVAPVKLITSPSGKMILDFGQNLVGYIRFKSGPAQRGHAISIIHTEVLENGECATRPLRGADAVDSYTFNGEEKEVVWNPRFTFHGFRYAQIDNWLGEVHLEDFVAVVCHTDFRRTGWFSTSDEMINRLHENVRWSMRGNFLEIPSDCPQRDERLGWTGDLQVFAPTAMFLYDCSGLLISWLRDLYAEQTQHNGIPPVAVPDILTNMQVHSNLAAAVWQDASVIVPWTLYEASGDKLILDLQYQSMQDWIRAIPRGSDGVLWQTQFQFGDWLDPLAPPDDPAKAMTDPDFVANAYLVHVIELVATVSSILGKEKETVFYRNLAKVTKEAFRKEYVTATGLKCHTQTGYALAIHFGLLTEEEQQLAGDRLVQAVIDNKFRIGTGFAGTSVICPALTKIGRNDLAYEMLLTKECPSWLYPVTMGATTTWERWDSMLSDGSVNPGDMTSFNHYALGCIAEWMHQVMAGLMIAEPGWKKVLIEPMPSSSKITEVNAKFDSPYGVFKSSWIVKHGQFILNVTLPPNTSGTVVLPTGEKFAVGSGSRKFTCDYNL